MQFRIQFLDGKANVILDLVADARNAAGAIALVVDIDWPPHAVSIPRSTLASARFIKGERRQRSD